MSEETTNKNVYFVSNTAYWFLLWAENTKKARQEAAKDLGNYTEVRLATQEEIKYYISLKGQIDIV